MFNRWTCATHSLLESVYMIQWFSWTCDSLPGRPAYLLYYSNLLSWKTIHARKLKENRQKFHRKRFFWQNSNCQTLLLNDVVTYLTTFIILIHSLSLPHSFKRGYGTFATPCGLLHGPPGPPLPPSSPWQKEILKSSLFFLFLSNGVGLELI